MALLDGDRFEGRFRDGVHAADVTDLMRRMVKEHLLKFDGTPLFPERIAYTVPYKLSEAEARLYKEVTEYVREEFNRADALESDKRAGTVGFALTILQRRLASSPEAIAQSLRRRRERLEARRLQPHYIESFFLEAFQRLGGSVKQREPRRYEVTHVSAPVRNRDRLIGIGEPVLPRYERIAFEKPLVAPPGQSLAAFVCPGHPLLDATIDLTLERHRDLLRRGAVLVDEGDFGMQPRLMLYLEHSIQDASRTRSGDRRVVSKRMLYVEMDASGNARHIHYAPYLDYRPLAEDEPGIDSLLARPECAWIGRDLEQRAQGYAVAHVVPEHWGIG
jgi:hypothetical protein